jgi:hypothetical protein
MAEFGSNALRTFLEAGRHCKVCSRPNSSSIRRLCHSDLKKKRRKPERRAKGHISQMSEKDE